MIRRRGKAARPARRAPDPVPAQVTHRASPSDHLILQHDLKCHCGQRAFTWMRCRVRRCLVATCGGHKMTITQEREAHEATHKEQR